MAAFTEQTVLWLRQHTVCSLFSSQGHTASRYQLLALVAGTEQISQSGPGTLAAVDAWMQRHKGAFIGGHLGFGAHEELFGLPSQPAAHIAFADAHFYAAETIVSISDARLTIRSHHCPETIYQEILGQGSFLPSPLPALHFAPAISRELYLLRVNEVLRCIARGDCYVLNYCIPFTATKPAVLIPEEVFCLLSRHSPNPMSVFHRCGHHYLMSASPERFFSLTGHTLVCQPIKGTAARILHNHEADARAAETLYHSAKDRCENVMVTDLVRNDMSRICQPGTVSPTALYQIHTLPQVHQMITTIQGHCTSPSFGQIAGAIFPAGSMTGAPKKKVLEITRALEPASRGLYSGTVGYIDEQNNMDFNVVIRSLQYDAQTHCTNYMAGGAITHMSEPGAEWDEVMLKGRAIRMLFGARE